MESESSDMKTEVEITDIIMNQPEKLSSLCRVCLSRSSESSLFEFSSLYQKVMLCARVQITERDGLPSAVCHQCLRELHVAYTFRTRCETSDTLLRKFYTNKQHLPAVKNEDLKDSIDLIKQEENPDSNVFSQVNTSKATKIKKRTRKKGTTSKKLKDINSDHFKRDTNVVETVSDDDLKADLNLECDYISDEVVVTNVDSVKKEQIDNICLICNKTLDSKYSLQMHVASEHNEKQRKDIYLKYEYYQQSDRRFKCSQCPFTAIRKCKLTSHLRVHTGERPYMCEKCSKSFSQKANLDMHMRIHNNVKDYICDTCGKQFRHKQNYKRHQNVHENVTDFTCSMCSKSLKSSESLKSHMDRHYNIKNFSCETCGMTFVTRMELLNHAKTHTSEKRFQCDICDFRTRMKKNLAKHIERHSGLRPFKCKMCASAFYTAEKLRLHVRTHTKEKCYSCPVCLMRFCHSSSVNKHMFNIHGILYKVNNNIDRRIVK